MRIATFVWAAVVLAGCDMITSSTPLFFPRDALGQAQLRPGVWVQESSNCVLDTTQPMDLWPDCADRWVVRPGEVLAGRDRGAPMSSATIYQTVLARGRPPILQVAVHDDTGVAGYIYLGLRPLKQDSEGRVIEYKAWPALCGPPSPPDPTGQMSGGSREPLPGLVMDSKGQDCVASSQGPVRLSAGKSEGWGDADNNKGYQLARWVRDAER
jgi:hypothetical protein